MDNNLIKDGQIRPNYSKAVQLHSQIMANGTMAAQALGAMCAELKQMRDEELYCELGYDSFDAYIEQAVGIKKRQAYNYISTYERLGSTILQSNASLGITKLALLADVPATERANFAENNDLSDMSVREMKEQVERLTRELGQSGEQLSLISTERDGLKKDIEVNDLARRKAERDLAAKDAELEETKRLSKIAAAPPVDMEKIRKDAEKTAQKGAKDKLKAEVEKARATVLKEADERLTKAKEEARAAGAEEARRDLAAAEQEKAAAVARAQELEKKLAIAGNKETVLFSHLFEEFQGNFNRMMGCVEKLKASDAETAVKLRGALEKCLGALVEKVK